MKTPQTTRATTSSSAGESSGKYTATLANRMLGGGAVKWYRDGGVYTSGSTLIPSVSRDVPRYGQPGADPNPVTVSSSKGATPSRP